MATSLLRLGRLGSLKCLMREGWGTQRTPLVAALCTKADGPPKPAKKAKGASKTIEAGERASLLAYKPTVAFPSKVSATGFLPKDISLTESSAKTVTADAVLAAGATTVQPPSVTESATSEKLTRTTESAETFFSANVDETTTDSPVADTAAEVIKEEAEITEDQHPDKVIKASEGSKASEAKTEVKHDQEDSSSSSSSDSESDSDSDDEKSEKKPKSEPVDESGEKATDEKKDSVYTQKQVDIAENKVHSESIIAPSASFEGSPEDAEAVKEAKPKELHTQSTEAVSPSETLIDPAPILSSSTTKAIPEVTSESITVVSPEEMVDVAPEVKTTPAEDITESVPETKAKAAPEQAQETADVKANPKIESSFAKAIDAVSEAVQEIVVKPEFEAETVAKADGATGIETTPSEDLKDAALVAADAVESLAETPQEQAPAKAPEPEPEPFDNTTYKNLQHHHYNMYTFADMDVEMSKHRLPQPSSGRPSPSH